LYFAHGKKIIIGRKSLRRLIYYAGSKYGKGFIERGDV
jgi:hypothetical protein